MQDEEALSPGEENGPCPRYAHQLVYDPNTKVCTTLVPGSRMEPFVVCRTCAYPLGVLCKRGWVCVEACALSLASRVSMLCKYGWVCVLFFAHIR